MRGVEIERQQPSVRRRIRPAYLILAVLLGLFAFKFVQKIQEVRGLQDQQATLQAQNAQIRRDNVRTKRAIRYYHSLAYIKAAARARFGYTMPGDVAIESNPIYQRAPRHVAVHRPLAPPEPAWQQWWQAFFG